MSLDTIIRINKQFNVEDLNKLHRSHKSWKSNLEEILLLIQAPSSALQLLHLSPRQNRLQRHLEKSSVAPLEKL